jgi:ketosteroid isomerase-like protein
MSITGVRSAPAGGSFRGMGTVTLVCLAVAVFGARPVAAQPMPAAERTRIEDSVRVFLTRYIAAYESRDLRAVMALYPPGGPVSSANDGRITTSRDSIESGIGRFLQGMREIAFTTDPPIVTALDSRTAVITLVFHGSGTRNDGRAFSTTGSWTAVLAERDGRFTIIQEQESHPRP